MSLNKKAAYIIAAIVLVFTLFLFLIYQFTYSHPSTFLNRTINKFFNANKNKEIVDEVYYLNYNLDPEILNHPKVVEKIRGTDVDLFTKKVVITADENKIGASYYENGNKVSGYGHEINYNDQTVILYIYINSQFVDKNELTYHLNSNYLGALLSAVEKNKMDKERNYRPNYNDIAYIVHELSVDIYDTNNYFLTIK